MPTDSPPALDAVRFFTLLALFVFDRDVAHAVGPYAVIVIGSLAGAGWALSAMPPMSRARGALFFLRTVATALLISVSLSMTLADYMGVDDPNLLLGGVALFIGSIGDRWPKVWQWVLSVFRSIVEHVVGTKRRRGDEKDGE